MSIQLYHLTWVILYEIGHHPVTKHAAFEAQPYHICVSKWLSPHLAG